MVLFAPMPVSTSQGVWQKMERKSSWSKSTKIRGHLHKCDCPQHGLNQSSLSRKKGSRRHCCRGWGGVRSSEVKVRRIHAVKSKLSCCYVFGIAGTGSVVSQRINASVSSETSSQPHCNEARFAQARRTRTRRCRRSTRPCRVSPWTNHVSTLTRSACAVGASQHRRPQIGRTRSVT